MEKINTLTSSTSKHDEEDWIEKPKRHRKNVLVKDC